MLAGQRTGCLAFSALLDRILIVSMILLTTIKVVWLLSFELFNVPITRSLGQVLLSLCRLIRVCCVVLFPLICNNG